MTPQELKEFAEKYYLGYSPLVNFLSALITAGVSDKVATSQEFDAIAAENPNLPYCRWVADDEKYTGDEDVLLVRIPGRGVGQIAIDFLTDETEEL